MNTWAAKRIRNVKRVNKIVFYVTLENVSLMNGLLGLT